MINKIIIKLIEFYRRYYSAYRPPVCRFTPSCSAYAITAFTKYNCLIAVKLVFLRLLRCGPWSENGIDQVP